MSVRDPAHREATEAAEDRVDPAQAAIDSAWARWTMGQRRALLVFTIVGSYLVVATAWGLLKVNTMREERCWAVGDEASRHKRCTTLRDELERRITREQVVVTRHGDVLDRNGVTLATDVRADHITADPRWIRRGDMARMPFDDPRRAGFRDAVAARLASVLKQPYPRVRERLARRVPYVVLDRYVDLDTVGEIRRLIRRGKLPGVHIEPAYRRYYPRGHVAGVLVGRKGWGGSIEHSFLSQLRGQEVRKRTHKDGTGAELSLAGVVDTQAFSGKSLVLTIDERIQAIADEQLARGVKEAKGDRGVAIVLDVHTAEVLAMSVAPRLDPGDRRHRPRFGWRNPAIQDQFEPGSTMKVFTLAAGLEEGVIKLSSHFKTGRKLKVGRWSIRDHHAHEGVSALEMVKVSSNIGAAKIAFRIGARTLWRYLDQLGFGRPTEIGLAGEIGGLLPSQGDWKRIRLATVAYGQGIASTPLQVAAAYAALGAGGVWRRPRIIRGVIEPSGEQRLFPVEPGRRVFSERTARLTLKAMTSVCEKGGTATRARLPDYRMAGKTGTAQQVDPKTRRYGEDLWVASFASLAPAEDPRLAILVMVENPRKRHPRLEHYIIRTGGAIAAPIVREIARFALPYLGVPPSRGSPWLAHLDPARARRKDEEGRARKERRDALRAARAAKRAHRNKPEQPADADTEPALQPPPALAQGTPERPVVPDLGGLPMREVRRRLLELGLPLEARGTGVAVAQRPRAGRRSRRGRPVRVTFKRPSEIAPIDAASNVELGGQP